jgi:hypothetical protein
MRLSTLPPYRVAGWSNGAIAAVRRLNCTRRETHVVRALRRRTLATAVLIVHTEEVILNYHHSNQIV